MTLLRFLLDIMGLPLEIKEKRLVETSIIASSISRLIFRLDLLEKKIIGRKLTSLLMRPHKQVIVVENSSFSLGDTRRVLRKDHDDIIRMYKDGKKISEISSKLGFSRTTIHNRINKEKIPS